MAAITKTDPGTKQMYNTRFMIAFLVMLAANSIQSFVFCVPPPVLPALSIAFNSEHHGVLIAQFVTPIAALGLMVGAGLSGVLIARTGLRRMVMATSLAVAVLGSAPLWTLTAPVLLGSRLLLGFVAALLLTCSTLLVVQNYTDDARPKIIGYQTAFSSVAFLGVIMLSGIILQYAGWRAPFAIYAVFGIVLFFLAFASVPQQTGIMPAEERGGGNLITHLWPIYISVLFLGILVTIIGVQLPFILTSRGVLSPIVQSLIIGNSTLFSAFTGFSYGRIQAAIGQRMTLGLSLISAGLGFIVMGFAPGAVLAGVGTALVGLGQGIFVAYMVTLTVQQTPPAAVGRAVGYVVAGLFLGSFMDPFFMGGLKILFGAAGAFFATGVLTVIVGAVCFLVRCGLLIGIPKPV